MLNKILISTGLAALAVGVTVVISTNNLAKRLNTLAEIQAMRPDAVFAVEKSTNWHNATLITNQTSQVETNYPRTNNCVVHGVIQEKLLALVGYRGAIYSVPVQTNIVATTNLPGLVIFYGPSNTAVLIKP